MRNLDYIKDDAFDVLLCILRLVSVRRQRCFIYRNRFLNGSVDLKARADRSMVYSQSFRLRGTKKFANSCRATSDDVQRRNPTFVDGERRRKLKVMKGQRTDTER